MKILRRTRFGNPVLREPVRHLQKQEILSDDVQRLIADMHYTLEKKQYGIGLAAPQVGRKLAITVLGIKPTPSRPNLEPFKATLINPKIIETYGTRTGMWEGCISFGVGADSPYAKALQYKKVKVRWLDEHAERHEQVFEDFPAHVVQHEVDHLNGVLFVDRVRDNKTFITIGEFKKRQ